MPWFRVSISSSSSSSWLSDSSLSSLAAAKQNRTQVISLNYDASAIMASIWLKHTFIFWILLLSDGHLQTNGHQIIRCLLDGFELENNHKHWTKGIEFTRWCLTYICDMVALHIAQFTLIIAGHIHVKTNTRTDQRPKGWKEWYHRHVFPLNY